MHGRLLCHSQPDSPHTDEKNLRRYWKLLNGFLQNCDVSIHILGKQNRVSNILTPELRHSLGMLCSSLLQHYPDIWSSSTVLATRHTASLIFHKSELRGVPGTRNRLTATPGARKSCWCVGPGTPFASREGRGVNERWVRSRGMKKGGWRGGSPKIKLLTALKPL